MHRRDFLRVTGLASTGLAISSFAPSAFAQALRQAQDGASDKWRTFEVTTRVEVLKPDGVTRVWLPTPLTADTSYLKALGNTYDAQGGTTAIMTDAKSGAGIVWAEWQPQVKPVLVLTSRFSTGYGSLDRISLHTMRPTWLSRRPWMPCFSPAMPG